MRLFVVVVLSCASWAMAQTVAVDTPASRPIGPQAPGQKSRIRPSASPGGAPAKPADVPPTTPVVTLKGVCKDKLAKTGCETVITRDDLDRYVRTFAPDVSETARGRLAVQYAGTVAYSSLAEQQGLDKNPTLAHEIEVELKLVRMRILGTAYLQSLQAQTTPIAPAEIQKYYEDHRALYEQVQVRRLSVPFVVPTADGRPLDRAAVKTQMDELRTRALAGEDLNQLQQDAYQHLHIQAAPPPVNVMPLGRLGVQGEETKVFDLNAGEFSPVLDLPASYAVFKVESKEPVALQFVRQDIEAALRAEQLKTAIARAGKKITSEFNLKYLGLASQPDIFAQTPATVPASRGRVVRTSRARP